ncbi:hypothetical protein [Actinacidiphila sp. ITFR-21]|uniref:hypothetical protein n=1 Tax=Actinacidiphila sp. ITFR-21 TaxID=3075199 RepID=UPI00288C17EC|nr:hypothetical protein [Streptomyces sp. ITFR-21]WNI17627.1 hypothetical protein RLT57_20270 [Streptomyces sp. ITFR-21]WNI17767.1 hypothetical protein RLT57_20985 [Streptomyces sp. ITFR-21]
MRGRLDWKKGRWNVNTETSLIHRGLRGWQRTTGDSITYFRWQYGDSEIHPVYDEATGSGKRFYGLWQLPALHVDHSETGNTEPRDSGLYIVDSLHVTAEFDQLAKTGLTDINIRHGAYQRDRIAYDNILFSVKHVDIRGQIRRRDIIVSIDAEQIRDDELVNDPQFSPYLRDFSRNPEPQMPEEGGSDDPYA